ncbi:S1C family serine protease [Aquibacillus koreensis]|uniref:S1C family serine protease n=1 Tax=Aquibacillus koreensis TaxID=279446 RepID=A0A9X3WNW2_9BACI|nr:S1C family serine protease [Aquibacillus koreensis]MCT2534343.1 S1C family serine protease [Aquibacillus koreensis]MDC3420664.1 S1C family serine protease [Aquibacillus koreensis]
MIQKHIILPILFSLVIIALSIGAMIFIQSQWKQESISVKNTLVTQVTEAEGNKDLKSIIHEAQKNVVQIEASTETSNKIGSGFLYNNKGDIITNAHVVKDATYITIKMANAQTYPAAIVGVGDKTDIAVIRVPQLANQSPAIVDDAYDAEIGDEIIAVGSPLGFQNSVTLGIVSGTNRTFSIDGFDYENVYQISANITNGNSGGPLISRNTGKVIAINSAGAEEGGIGFSIPIHKVLDQVNKWSNQAKDQDLVYSDSMSIDHPNPTQLEDDAKYIINYFFDSLAIRDYINAYALLGSEWQTKTNYQSFRSGYIHIVDTKISNMDSNYLENENQVKVTLVAENTIRNANQQTNKEVREHTFYIGYENDQLKIINGDKTLAQQ